jgi:hypothetical protein
MLSFSANISRPPAEKEHSDTSNEAIRSQYREIWLSVKFVRLWQPLTLKCRKLFPWVSRMTRTLSSSRSMKFSKESLSTASILLKSEIISRELTDPEENEILVQFLTLDMFLKHRLTSIVLLMCRTFRFQTPCSLIADLKFVGNFRSAVQMFINSLKFKCFKTEHAISRGNFSIIFVISLCCCLLLFNSISVTSPFIANETPWKQTVQPTIIATNNQIFKFKISKFYIIFYLLLTHYWTKDRGTRPICFWSF